MPSPVQLNLHHRSAIRSSRSEQSGAITTTQALLLAILVVVSIGLFAGIRWVRTHRGTIGFLEQTPYSFTETIPGTNLSPTAQVEISSGRGDITVVPEDDPELRVIATKTAYAANQGAARAAAGRVRIAIHEDANGTTDIRPAGLKALGARGNVSIEVHVPRRAGIRATTGQGDVRISGSLGNISAIGHGGAIEIRDCGGDISASQSSGSIRIIGDAGNVTISGAGKELEIVDVKGQAAIDGNFSGPIHLARIEQGIRLVSGKTNLAMSRLDGQVEFGLGRLRISGNSGDLTLTAQGPNVSVSNPGGRVQITGQNGIVSIYYAQPPRADISVQHKGGNLLLSLPPQSTFKLNATTIGGNLSSTFSGLAETGNPESNNFHLYGQVGTKGPMIVLRNSGGSIHIRRRGY